MSEKVESVSVFHIGHRWSKWSEPEDYATERAPRRGEESAVVGNATITVTRELQRRRCLICNAQQGRFVSL